MQRATRFSHWVLLAGVSLGGLGLAGCAGGPAGEQRAANWTGKRSVAMRHTESGERVNVVYGQDGQYDMRAMDQVASLFRDRRTGDVNPIDPKLLDVLVTVRERLGLEPAAVFEVTSGYRSPITNAALARRSPNVAENSYHMRGQAVDFHIDGVSSERIASAAGDLALGGYAWYPHTGHVHLDTGPVRTWTPRSPQRGGGWIDVKATRQRSAMAVATLPPAKAAALAKLKPGAAKAMAGKPGAKPVVGGKPAAAAKPAGGKPAGTKPAAAKSMVAAKPTKVQVALRK